MALSLEELEQVARLGMQDSRWLAICDALVVTAHKLSSSALARAVEALASVREQSIPPGQQAEECCAAAFREAAEALLACLTHQLASASTAMVINALRLLGAARVSEQTFLDMIL